MSLSYTKYFNHGSDEYSDFSVGYDVDNNVVLKISIDDTTNTLTMTDSAVRKLIRLLESTLEEDESYN